MNPTPQQATPGRGRKIALLVAAGIGLVAVLLIVLVVIAVNTSADTEPASGDGLPADFDDYLADLDAIDPGITEGRPEEAVFGDADNTCADIQAGTADDILLDRTMQRYGVNDAADIVTEDIAQQILDATREHCDTIRPE